MIDNQEIASVSRQSIRQNMALISQDPLLLDLSLRENLDIEGICSDAEIWEAIQATHCKSVVDKLPGGLDYQIAANGGILSRGEWQLLALCRALLQSTWIKINMRP